MSRAQIAFVFHEGELWAVRVEALPSGGLVRLTYPTPGRGCRYDLQGPFDLVVAGGEIERMTYRYDRIGD